MKVEYRLARMVGRMDEIPHGIGDYLASLADARVNFGQNCDIFHGKKPMFLIQDNPSRIG